MAGKYFDLKVGFTCNNYCVHCVITDKKETNDLTTEEIKHIIDGVPKGDIIGFTGGEATIRKDFIELLKYAKATGHYTALQTNGSMLYDDNFAKEVSKYLDSCLIALHSHIEEIHNKIVDCPSSANMYKRTVQGFKNLIKYKVNTRTQTVISSFNIKDLPETYDWIQSISPGIGMSMTYPHPNGNAYHNHEIVCPRYKDIKPYIHKALAKWAYLLSVEAIPLCYLFPYQNDVHHNFDTNIIEQSEITTGVDPANKSTGFFDDEGKTENYQESMLNDKLMGPKCLECIFKNKCAGVWKEYIEFYRDKLDLYPITKSDLECIPKTVKIEKEKIKYDIPEKEVRLTDKQYDSLKIGSKGAIIVYGSGTKCMNTCNFCNGSRPDLSDSERWNIFVKEAQYFIDNKVDMIEISGGDPGEYNLIVDVVRYLKDNGIRVIQLSTHGRTLANEQLVKSLADAGLDHCKIPLYGSTAEIHNKTTGDDRAFDESVAGIKNCVKHGIIICGHTIVNNHNKEDLLNIYNFYLNTTNRFMKEMILSVAYLTRTTEDYYGDWFIPLYKAKPYLKHVVDNKPRIPDYMYFGMLDIPYCAIEQYDEDIIVSRPPDLGVHKIEESNRSKEDDGIPQYRIKTYFSECTNCDYNGNCNGITVNEFNAFGTGDLKAINNQAPVKSDCDSSSDYKFNIDSKAYRLLSEKFEELVGLDDVTEFSIKISGIIKLGYNIVRDDPSTVDDLYDICNYIVEYTLDKEFDTDKFYNKILSLISFKNDIKLQQKLKPNLVDRYFEEVKFIISKGSYLKDPIYETGTKVCECLGKIQHAYNLLECDLSIKDIYDDVVKDMGKAGVLKNRFDIISSEDEITYSYFNLGSIYLNYVLFNKNTDHKNALWVQSTYFALFSFWKLHKTVYYVMDSTDVLAEGFNNYDFIYR